MTESGSEQNKADKKRCVLELFSPEIGLTNAQRLENTIAMLKESSVCQSPLRADQ